MTEDRLHELLRLRKTGLARKGWRCPGPTMLAAYADGKLEGKLQSRFERHLADCDYCLNELALLVRAQELGQEHELSPEVLARIRYFAESKVRFTLKPAWAWTALPAATVLLVLFTTLELREPRVVSLPPPPPATATSETAPSIEPSVSQPGAPALPSVRSVQNTAAAPEFIFPVEGALIARGKLRFHWREVKGSRDYEILVVTAEGNVVWQGRSEQTHVQLPPDVSLTPEQKYFVWVRANLPEGKTAKSAVVSFRIDKPTAEKRPGH